MPSDDANLVPSGFWALSVIALNPSLAVSQQAALFDLVSS